MKKPRSKIAGALILGAFTLGVAGSSFAGAPAAADASASDYDVSRAAVISPDATEADAMDDMEIWVLDGNRVIIVPHRTQTLPQELTHNEAVLDV
jgi:hypothetical protein